MVSEIEKLADFIHRYAQRAFPHDELLEILEGHIKFNTLIVLRDEKGIAAVCRFNVEGATAFVIDLIVRTDAENEGLIGYITAIGWQRFPYLRYVRFERPTKYPDRAPRVYPIHRLLNKARTTPDGL